MQFESLYRFLERIGYDHPLHPPLAHMPAGLVIGAFFFFLAALVVKGKNVGITAYHCLVMALVFAVPTALLGFTDWQHYYGSVWSVPIAVKMVLTALLFIFLIAGMVSGIRKRGGFLACFTIYFLSAVMVAGLGYFGAQLVFAEKQPFAQGDFQAGEKLYAANCAGCHPQGGNVMAPSLPAIGSPQLKSIDTFTGFNRNPLRPDGSRGLMPAFPKERLTDRELAQIYQYIVNVLSKKTS